MNDLKVKLMETYELFETYKNLWMIWKWNLCKLMNDLKLIKTYEWLETYKSLWIIRNYDYKNLRENLFNLKKYFENLGKLVKIKSRSCIEKLFNFISLKNCGLHSSAD